MSEASQPSHKLICPPCKETWMVSSLGKNLRCPRCGGIALPTSRPELSQGVADAARHDVRILAIRIMRITSMSMYSVPIGMYFYQDRLVSDFFTNVVTPAATLSTIATEVWSSRKSRGWMLLAVLVNLAAAVLFFFVAVGFFSRLFSADLATLLAVLPLGGSILAITQLRECAKTVYGG
ncbi:MAG: hypothetical protein ACO1TE_04250 [Prosthecobacter sp.]